MFADLRYFRGLDVRWPAVCEGRGWRTSSFCAVLMPAGKFLKKTCISEGCSMSSTQMTL